MNDPSEYSNVGENFVLDEKERQTRLSNETIEHIESREAVAEEATELFDLQTTQPATAEQPEPTEPETQPTGEEKTEEKGFFDLSGVGQGLSYFGQPIGETNEQVKERLSAPGQGIIDTVTNAVNKILPDNLQIPTATKYEDQVAQVTRDISGPVVWWCIPPMTARSGVRDFSLYHRANISGGADWTMFQNNPARTGTFE